MTAQRETLEADVLIVAGPRTAFLEPEVGALEKHLASGGRLFLLLDPVLPGPGAPPIRRSAPPAASATSAAAPGPSPIR